MTEGIKNIPTQDRITLRTAITDDFGNQVIHEKHVMDLPKGRANYGGRPDGHYSPSSVLVPGIDRLDLTKVGANGSSYVEMEGALVGEETVIVPIPDGRGSRELKPGVEVAIDASNLTAAVTASGKKETQKEPSQNSKANWLTSSMQSFGKAKSQL